MKIQGRFKARAGIVLFHDSLGSGRALIVGELTPATAAAIAKALNGILEAFAFVPSLPQPPMEDSVGPVHHAAPGDEGDSA